MPHSPAHNGCMPHTVAVPPPLSPHHLAPTHCAAKPMRSEVSAITLAVGLPAPCPARTSTRIKSGLRCVLLSGSPLASWCCSSAISFKLCSGTTLHGGWDEQSNKTHHSEIEVRTPTHKVHHTGQQVCQTLRVLSLRSADGQAQSPAAALTCRHGPCTRMTRRQQTNTGRRRVGETQLTLGQASYSLLPISCFWQGAWLFIC